MPRRRDPHRTTSTIACAIAWATAVLFTTKSADHQGTQHNEYMAAEVLSISVASTMTIIAAVARIARTLATAFAEGYASAIADLAAGRDTANADR